MLSVAFFFNNNMLKLKKITFSWLTVPGLQSNQTKPHFCVPVVAAWSGWPGAVNTRSGRKKSSDVRWSSYPP